MPEIVSADSRSGHAGLAKCTILAEHPGRVRLQTPRWRRSEAEPLLRRLRLRPGVRTVRYEPAAQTLTVVHDHSLPIETIIGTLPEDPGAERASLDTAPARAAPSLRRQLLGPAIALAAGLTGIAPVSVPLVALAAVPIARRAAGSLRRRHLSIDVLDATAVSLLLGGGDLLAAGVSVALIETGERIRSRASGRARRVLRGWMGADVRGVRILRGDSEPRVPITDIAIGDRAVVYTGETIPVDGVVVAGTASVDNRTWTGEPTPVDLRQGGRVLAGGVINDGRIVIDVRATGDETRAGRLAAALEDALAADTQVSDLARRLADRFVSPLFLLGALTFGITRDVSRLVSILIVDFGTGIRIAVPTSVLSTMVAGARGGILFRNGRAIEAFAAVDCVVFDKTGTLTTGHPTITAVLAENGFDHDQVLRLAASAEGHLPHPIARAVRRHARRAGLALPQPDDVRYQQGGGVIAHIEGHEVLVGDRRLLEERGIEAPQVGQADSSVVVVAIDGRLAARLQLRDRLKPGLGEVMAALRGTGIRRLWMATGDRRGPAASVTQQLGLDGYSARLLPEGKVTLVRRLREEGYTVAMVGDGINDAAAMAEAQVGIAVPRGADLARETADVVLGGEDLMTLVHARSLAKTSMRLVRENIGLVAVPNGIALGMATAGALPPLAATAVNNGSTLIAAINALRPLRSRLGPPVTAED